jgi:hypothetical protein
MVITEQEKTNGSKIMSSVLWDMFTGSSPYREVLFRTMRPKFIFGLLWNLIAANSPFGGIPQHKETP